MNGTRFLVWIGFFGLTLFRGLALAYECTDINLTLPGPWGMPGSGPSPKEWRGSMQYVAATGPANLRDCHAHAAAGLLDAWRFSHSPPLGDENFKHKTSPLEAALISRVKDSELDRMISHLINEDDTSGGRVCPVVEALQLYGTCDIKKTLDSDRRSLQAQEFYVRNLRLTYDVYHDRLSFLTPEIGQWNARAGATYACGVLDGVGIPRDLLPSVPEIQKYILESDHARDFMAKMAAAQCGQRQPISDQMKCQMKVEVISHAGKYRNFLHHQLENAAPVQPIAIAFCAQVLHSGPGHGEVEWNKAWKVFSNGKCGAHNALVVGRRWNRVKNRCEFLVRDSGGTNCGSHHKEWECDAKGSLWVDDEALSKSIMSTEFLK